MQAKYRKVELYENEIHYYRKCIRIITHVLLRLLSATLPIEKGAQISDDLFAYIKHLEA